MPYLYIENFVAGLDTRKTRFTAPPGSLRVLRNAHITRGQEIERRKAFDEIYTLPAATFGLHAARDQLYTFGSGTEPAGIPPVVEYQRLVSPDAGNMVDLLAAENFDGKVYAVAEFDDGTVHHYYNGTRVTDWATIAGNVGDTVSIARVLGAKMDEDDAVDAVVVGDRVVLTSTTAGESFTLTTSADLTATELQAATAAQSETRAEASFEITGGSPGQTFNTIEQVMADGVELLGGPVDFVTDNATTAQAVADKINAYTTGYTASASLAVVTIQAPPGLGASANGRVLTVETAGDVTVGSITDFAGGADPVDATPQISQVKVDTYAAATLYTVTLNGVDYKTKGESSGMARTVRAVRDKMYAVTSSLLYFSGFADNQPDPTRWINDEAGTPAITGAGFINLSTQYGGSEELTGIGVYQDKVAAFSARTVQIWNVDPDPAQNIQYQVLINIGAIAADSIVEYGDVDVFFLSESGVRSMRARDSSNLASANDVGVNIDAELTAFMADSSRRDVRRARAVVEPKDGRYLLSIGQRVYVFSNFPGSRVSAWSTYDLGGRVDAWTVADSRLYARVGDSLRLYGGYSGDEYDTAETEVVMPFLDSENPAGHKQMQGIDLGAEGRWDVDMALEPDNPDELERLATIEGSTYGSLQRVGVRGKSTHISLRFTTSQARPARIGNAIFHYRDLSAD